MLIELTWRDKTDFVLSVVIVGAFYIKAANYTPFIPPAESGGETSGGIDQSVFSLLTGAEGSTYGWYGLLAGASIVFFAFIGFDIVATTAEETKNPQRDVPRGILFSLAIVTALYVAVSVVLSGMVPYTDLKTGPDGQANLASAFSANGVEWAATVISIGALAGLTTVVMVLLLGQIRVVFAMSRDGLLPRGLARTGPQGTPVRITVVVGVVVALAASVFPIGRLEEMVNVGTLFAFVLVSAGVIVLRRTRPDLKRGFRAPWVPALPIVSIIACVWLMLNLTGLTWIRFGVWMAIGVVVYLVYGRRHSVLGGREAAVESPT
jgi:APA family basic amino acid/polyamine antiporter